MGPKLLAAFGAGALVASTAIYFAGRPPQVDREEPVAVAMTPQPEQASPAIPLPEPHPAVAAPQPKPPTSPVRRQVKKKAKTFTGTVAAKPTAPEPEPVVAAISMPYVDITPSPESGAANLQPDLPPPAPLTVTLPAGTLLQVRLGERLASDRNVTDDTFFATLDAPLVGKTESGEQWVIAEKGARVLGRVAEVDQAGRVEGTARLALELVSLTASDKQKIQLRTAPFVRKGDTSRKDDAVKIGAGAAIGAIIGAIAGGGKGAAIGAASGGAAGTGAVLATRGKAAVLDAETRLSFALSEPLTITERR